MKRNALNNGGNALTLTRVIRDRFDEISEWYTAGVRWSEIDARIRESGLQTSKNSVRRLYYREFARRTSSKRIDTYNWVSKNYQAIKDLRDQGLDWGGILTLVQPDVDNPQALPTLKRFITEFNTINQARNHAQPKKSAPSQQLPSPTSTPTPPPPIVPSEPAAIALVSAPKIPVEQKVVSGPNELQSELQSEPGLVAKLMKEYGTSTQKKPRRPHYVKPLPQDDPYVSGPELFKQYKEAKAQALALYEKLQDAPSDEKEDILDRREVFGSQADQLKVNFEHRFSHDKATRSKLTVLSTAAITCGVYRVVSEGNSDPAHTIKLCGYDRPDHIDEMDEIPDPIFIEENLTQQEQTKITQAYAQDKESFPYHVPGKSTPARQLAEALLVRGEYVKREGWYEYDKIVKLKGDDLPSPTLAQIVYLHPNGPFVELNPPLKADDPPEPENTIFTPPELKERGDWL